MTKDNGIAKMLIILSTLFLAGYMICLPIPYNTDDLHQYPWFAKKWSMGPVQSYELLFIIWLMLYGGNFLKRVLTQLRFYVFRPETWMFILGTWLMFVAILALPPDPFFDFARSCNLILTALIYLASKCWAHAYGVRVLIAYLCGVFLATIVNLWFSFYTPREFLGMTILAGQTPGLVMGLSVHLCAWLYFLSNDWRDKALSLLFALPLIYGAAISYSRPGWFSCGLGLLAWSVVFLTSGTHKHVKWKLLLVSVCVGIVLLNNQAMDYISDLVRLVTFKSENTAVGSNEQRMIYVWGVLEILQKNPLGVSFSGFYDSYVTTDAYRFSIFNEDRESSNPHSAFLIYASAGGILGFVFVVILFFLLLHQIWTGLRHESSHTGILLAVFFIPSIVLTAIADPAIFSQLYLIFPAAIAGNLQRAKYSLGRTTATASARYKR